VSSSRPPDMSSGADDARQQERDVHKPRVSKLEIAVWVFLLAILVAVAGPFFMTPRLAADRTTALSSIKCMNLALIAFDNDYGRFPDATTIADVKAATHTTIPLGDRSSNELFRQLIAVRNHSEMIFWAPSQGARKKPNNVLGADTLAKGECSFAYVAGLSTKHDPSAPVVMGKVITGTTQFDPAPYGEKAVMLRIDGSARPETIRTDTNEVILGGKNLFDPSQPYWHGKAPDLKHPE